MTPIENALLGGAAYFVGLCLGYWWRGVEDRMRKVTDKGE